MRRILVIEDDEVQAAGAMRILRREGMHCDHSRTFADALTRTTDVAYDCAILDLGLPDEDIQDGFEAARRIPELGCPVVAWTGSGDPDIIAAVRATGAAIVLKPGVDLLVEKVWSQINYRHPDRESETGQQNAQRSMQKKGFVERQGAKILLAIAILSFVWAILNWNWAMARQYEVTRQEVATINRRLDITEAHGIERDTHLGVIDRQNQISIDDRANLHMEVSAISRNLEKIDDHLMDLLKKTK